MATNILLELPDEMVSQMDTELEKRGYKTRPELIRDLIRRRLEEWAEEARVQQSKTGASEN